jgi:iron complex transport system substrate-binding protein
MSRHSAPSPGALPHCPAPVHRRDRYHAASPGSALAESRRPGPGRRLAILAAVVSVGLLGVAACGSSSNSGSSSSSGSAGPARTQTITDAAGRKVTIPVPSRIHRIVMVGAPPDIDGFVVAAGDAKLIVNGVPPVFSSAHFGWKILEPRLVHLPNVESNIEAPVNPEELLTLRPDIVLTMDPTMAGQIQKLGIPTVVITEEGSGMEQERDAMTLLGKVLGKQQQAAAYVSYFDSMLKLVHQRIAGVPAAQRPSALYLATRPFRRNGPAMVWYLNYLGVTDVAGNAPPLSQFTTEQILRWNPDYIIAHDPTDVPVITHNSVLSHLAAVRDGHVKPIPQDLNEWGDFDVAAPLALLWAAKYLYPHQFADINMVTEAKAFYSRFYGENLTMADLNEILYGIGGSKVNFGA